MDMSRNGVPEFTDVLMLTHPGLRKNISHIEQTWLRLAKLHQTRTTYVESTTLSFLLPFSSKINSCICKALQDRHGHINWKICLASVTVLVRGSTSNKIAFIQKLYGEEWLHSMRCILKDVLRGAQRIAISLNVELPELSGRRENIGSAKYNGDAALELILDNVLTNIAEQESAFDLQKVSSVSWRSTVSCQKQEVPCSRSKHSACVNGQSLYILGGRDGRYLINDLWKFDLLQETWTEVKTTGDAPPSLEEHTMISYGHSIFVFGGISRMSVDEETPLWILDTSCNKWTHWESESEVALPPCLKGHSAVLVERNMYIFGGYEELPGSSELMWSFDILDEQWHLVYSQSTKGSGPSPRHYHSATLHNNAMIVVGGVNNLNLVNDMWSWSFSSCHWTKIKAVMSHPTIYGHTAVKLANSIFVMGGQNQNGLSNAVWEFKMNSTVWKKTDVKASCNALSRCHHVSIFLSPHMYSWVPPTQRTHSVPAMGSSKKSDRTIRPRTTSPTVNSHQPPLIFHNKVGPFACDTNCSQLVSLAPERAISRLQHTKRDVSKTTRTYKSIATSKSDYGVGGSYFRSDSTEPLLEQTRAWSDSSFTFDNSGYINSYDELTTIVSLGATAPPTAHSYHKSSVYGQLSRSLDSIQDVAHDDSACRSDVMVPLPGSVLSYSDETINETCTVRNIVLDEFNQAWTESFVDEVQELQDEETSPPLEVPTQRMPYKLLIIGGQEERRKISSVAQPLVMWVGEINTPGDSKRDTERCIVS